MTASYYFDKVDSLREIFGRSDVVVDEDAVRVGERCFPVVDDVVILQPVNSGFGPRFTASPPHEPYSREGALAADIQFTFGAEWKKYNRILAEHESEFWRYFDLVDLSTLRDARICDLGCGIGRWSYFLTGRCRELVLVDFSEAIFVARRNLADAKSALFFMGDLTELPFADDFCDFLLCLGVLHHLPTPCLAEVRALRRYARRLLVYLYYDLDNRPKYFRLLLLGVTGARRALSKIRRPRVRKLVAVAGANLVYKPIVLLGRALQPFGLARHLPLYEFYRDRSLERIEQDVYDRFFTPIEQRVSRQEILDLRDTFAEITVSDALPYWHFLAVR